MKFFDFFRGLFMGYGISSYENKFFVKRENQTKALDKIIKFTQDNENLINEDWPWVNSREILQTDSLKECLGVFGWECKFNKKRDIAAKGYQAGKSLHPSKTAQTGST